MSKRVTLLLPKPPQKGSMEETKEIRLPDFYKGGYDLIITENGSLLKVINGVKVAKSPDPNTLAKILYIALSGQSYGAWGVARVGEWEKVS